ncbi:MAG: polysaccharide deacetylase family protein [Geobacter sp.]|nr:MAG: polysaccharide deacetylase family protein [Geobacter sp.]
MKSQLKHLITRSHLALRSLDTVIGSPTKVLVYHRFAPPGRPIAHRVSAETFAWQLDIIKRDFDVINFGQCIAYFEANGEWPRGCVVLTIDDGYHDVYQFAWPELVKRDLTATFFVTTAFVDGTLWLWPDRLEFALSRSRLDRCTISMDGCPSIITIRTAFERAKAWKLFSDHCITLKNQLRLSFLDEVEAALEVEVPSIPPPEYAALSWDQLAEMQRTGIEIGGHTVTHPILSKVRPDQLDSEVKLGRELLADRLGAAIESFCYTNSGPGDINNDVIAAVIRAGYRGAVFGTDLGTWDRYQVPRMGVTDDRTDFLWKLYGLESMTHRIRSGKQHGR